MSKKGPIIPMLCVIALGVAAAGQPVHAAGRGNPGERNAVSLNPFGLISFFGALLDVQYEMRRTMDSSIAFRAGIGGRDFGPYNSFTAFGVGGMYRMWPQKTALQGFYWGPSAAVSVLSISIENPSSRTSASSTGLALGIGAEAGYQHIFHASSGMPEGFLLDGSFGLRFTFGSLGASAGGYSVTVPWSGLDYYLRGGIGYAWR